jgi:hypothetical protein
MNNLGKTENERKWESDTGRAESPSKVIGTERKLLMGLKNSYLTKYYDSL